MSQGYSAASQKAVENMATLQTPGHRLTATPNGRSLELGARSLPTIGATKT